MNTGRLFMTLWKVAPKIPLPLVYALTNLSADIVWRLNLSSVKQMRKNYAQFAGKAPSERLVREGVRSYFRCFGQQFTLPGWSKKQIKRSMTYPGAEATKELMKEGPVILALTHSGNWDLAGAWFCQNYGPILTVAEKLDPPELFDAFVEFREGLGMEIIGVGPGEHIFGKLVEKAKGRGLLVPLLADRDISGSGIEVDLGAGKALVAAGPAALAKALNRPLIAGYMSYSKVGRDWVVHAHFTEPIPMPEPGPDETDVEAWTRAWVDRISPVISEHLVDWHMMQKVFVADLDAGRLERARRRAEQEHSDAHSDAPEDPKEAT